MTKRHLSILLLSFVAIGCGGSVTTEPTTTGGPTPTPSGTSPSPTPSGTTPPSTVQTALGSFGYDAPPSSIDSSTIVATATDATYSFDCMSGHSPAITLAGEGFSVQGTLTTTGGVIQTYPNATFVGDYTGETITLRVFWTDPGGTSQSFGPVTLSLGVVPTNLPGCI